jgi:hypothetical protein
MLSYTLWAFEKTSLLGNWVNKGKEASPYSYDMHMPAYQVRQPAKRGVHKVLYGG